MGYTVNYTFYRKIVLILTDPKWCRDSKAIKDRKLCYIFRKGFDVIRKRVRESRKDIQVFYNLAFPSSWIRGQKRYDPFYYCSNILLHTVHIFESDDLEKILPAYMKKI